MTTKATAQMGGLTRLEIDNRVDRICSRLSRHGYDAQIDDLRDLRDLALQAIDRWVPVSERMPENFQAVRIRTHEGSELSATCFDATFRVDDLNYGTRWLLKSRVTHWLDNLPPPPGRP